MELTHAPFSDIFGLRIIYADVRDIVLAGPEAACTALTRNAKCRLMKEATIESKQGGERGITARSVRKVTGVGIIHHTTSLLFRAPLLIHSGA